jgi:hypothetical protein
MHNLVLSGRAPGAFESWERFNGALEEHSEHLACFVAERPIQTNEVQRSWVLLPCFLELSRRTGAETLELIELGPSAGLNLVWDRYRYQYDAGSWGPRAAPLELRGEERSPVPGEILALAPRVHSRTGIDLRPVDLATDEGVRLLKSFVWADQIDRLRRLDHAIEALRADPPKLVQGDFVELLAGLLSQPRSGELTVVFQTATLGYLTPEQRGRVRTSLEEAGEAAPLAFVSTVGPREQGATHWGVSLQLWPGGEAKLVAEADYHGSWLDWFA